MTMKSLRVRQIACVDSHADEDQIVDEVRTVGVLERRVRDEHRTAAGHVHRRPRFLETGAARVRTERVLDVTPVGALIEQR